VPRFRAVLLDWRGTLVVAPTYRWLIETALSRMGRPVSPSRVAAIEAQLGAADSSEVDSSNVDTSAELHARAYQSWFEAAGLERDLASELYAVESDPALNVFADDVGPLLTALHAAGIRIGVLSDVHVDLRPSFSAQRTAEGVRFVDLIDTWVLSFEVRLAKPDPAIFELALELLGMPSGDVLMVGDRATHDGAAIESGITTLILPPLAAAGDARLQRVLDLVIPERNRQVDHTTKVR
jgi:FMN phosphatase YigB (HAD superfamily)